MAFGARSQPLATSKRSVMMTETDAAGQPTQRARPAPRTVLKDGAEPNFTTVHALDDEQFLVAWGGIYVGSARWIELRTLTDAALVASFTDCGGPFAVSGGLLLANGALSGGYRSETRVIDLATRRTLVDLPVAYPFTATRAGQIFATIRKHYDFQNEPVVDPELAARFPALRDVIATHEAVLVKTTLAGDVDLVVPQLRLAEPYPELRAIALSCDETTLYYAATRSVGALDTGTGEIRWVKHFGEATGSRFLSLHALALAPDGRRLAVGGYSGSSEPALRVLDARTGEVLHEYGQARFDTLLFHGSVLLAGNNRGQLVLFDEAYCRRELTVATGKAAVNDLAVIAGGVLCACNRRQLRFVPLLDDE